MTAICRYTGEGGAGGEIKNRAARDITKTSYSDGILPPRINGELSPRNCNAISWDFRDALLRRRITERGAGLNERPPSSFRTLVGGGCSGEGGTLVPYQH